MLYVQDTQRDLNEWLLALKTKSYTCKAIVDGEPELSELTVTADDDKYKLFEFFSGRVKKVTLEETFCINYLHIILDDNEWSSNYSLFTNVISVEWDAKELKLYIVGSHVIDGCEATGIHILEFEKVPAEKV